MHFQTITKLLGLPNVIVIDALECGDGHFHFVVALSGIADPPVCSWLCPVGTVSEMAGKLGRRLFGRNFAIWRPLDVALRGTKYLLLLFFVKVILVDMTALALAAFLDTPYWAVSDVKMLHFFTRMSATTMVVLSILAGLTMLYVNFWCRCLCPYGALLCLASILSPWKTRRDAVCCTGCRSCSASCPAALPVHSLEVVRSPECGGCLNCTASCPEQNVLRMAPPRVAADAAGMASGNWHSSLGYRDYQLPIPMVPYIDH